MSARGIIDRLGIRGRVVFTTALPVILVALLLGYTLTSHRLEDLRKDLDERGRIIASNLALAAEFPTLSQNAERLRDVLRKVAADPEVRWAAVWDSRRGVLISRGYDRHDSRAVLRFVAGGPKPNPTFFSHPIRAEIGALTDYAEEFAALDEEVPADDLLGWALIELSSQRLSEREADIVRSSLLITLGGLLFSMLLGLAIGNGITEPLGRLMGTVRDLRAGNLAARIRQSTGGEIGGLEEGINEMAVALQEAQTRLQERVAVATDALRATVAELERKNRELESARHAALAAGQERTQFLARMSHEIRTPLNAVVGFSRLLGEARDAQAVGEYLGTIERAADQLLAVIDDILQFIRLDANADRLEWLEFDVADCLEDVVTMLIPAADQKGLELVLLLHGDLPARITGDPSRVAQVVMNLVNNAIKFTDHGHVVIEAGYTEKPDGGGAIEIAVSDSGPGLEPEEQQRVFAPFSQADSSVTRRFGGAGLGLSIAMRLVQLMGGEIGVSSRKGEGSRFWFCLPADSGPETKGVTAPPGIAGRKVLLYDRNGFSRRSLRGMLIGWSVQVYNARDREALSKLSAGVGDERIDLLVLSLSPEESADPGSLERMVERIRHGFDGPMLLLSGKPGWRPSERLRSLEPLAWETKPIRHRVLRGLLERLFDGAPGRASTARPSPGKRFSLAGARILAVEDNALNRALLHRILEEWGAEVEEVASGGEAVEAAQRSRYDVILMDLHMPDMDGAEATRRIRAMLGAEAPPIIAVTADVFGESELPNAAGLFDEWLLKPVDPALIEQRVAAHIARDGVSASADQETADRPEPPDVPKEAGVPLAARLPAELRRRYRDEIQALCREAQLALAAENLQRASALVHDLNGLTGIMGKADAIESVRALKRALDQHAMLESARLLRTLEQQAAELLREQLGPAKPGP